MEVTEPVIAQRNGRLRIFLVLFSSFLVMIAACAVAVGYGVHRYWEDALRLEITRNLAQKAKMLAVEIASDHEHKIQDIVSQQGLAAGARATVIDANGSVLADSEVPVANLQDEGRRPEFAAALKGETSVVTRKRNDFGMPVLNVAVPFSGGAVRLAYPLADVDIATAHARRILLIGSLLATLAAVLISILTANTMVPKRTQ